jgi:hypothetical protein
MSQTLGQHFTRNLEWLHRAGDNAGFPAPVSAVSKRQKNRIKYRTKFNESATHSLNNQ